MPPAEIVTGTPGALEEALAGAIAGARAADPLAPVTVLVDNVLLRPYLRRAIALRGVPLLNVLFVRPNELAALMGLDTPSGRLPVLSPGAERLLAREIAAGAGGYFAPVATRDGFAEALHRLFREIDLGGFSPGGFAEALGGGASADASKERELARLYAAYSDRRTPFASVPALYAAAVQQRLDGPLLVYGVWAPRTLQSTLVDHIASDSAVTVFLPQANIEALDDACAAYRTHLLDGGASERVLNDASAPAIARTLFAGGSSRAGATAPVIELINAPDTVREIWEAARACLRWAAEGIRFHEMAIVYRNRDPYRALIDEIFTEAGIETYLHDGRLLSTHPLGRRVLSLLQLAEDAQTFPRGQVMEFLTETELPRATRDRYDRVRPSEWETYTREAGVVDGIDQWERRLERLAAEKRAGAARDGMEWLDDVARRVETLIAFAKDLHAALAARTEEATWDEHLTFLRSLAESYADNVGPLLDALEDLRSLAAVRERVPFDIFCRAVRDDLESRDTSMVLKEPVREFGRRGVAVIDATALKHVRFRTVCLVGVAERAWPPPPRPNPLLLERERRRVNEHGAGHLPLRTEPDAEPLAFWLAAQSAADHLSISYARADAGRSGKHLPSYFFRAVVEALEGRSPLALDDLERSAHVQRFEAGRLACADLGESLSGAEYDRGLARAAYEQQLAAAVDALAEASPTFGRALAARSARRAVALSPYDGLMVSDAARRAALDASVFAQGKAVSASRLEKYAVCPYQYFLDYVLRIDPVEEPEDIQRIDHLQRGSLIHEILQLFLAGIGRGDPPRAERRAEHLRALIAIAREAGADREHRGVTGRPLIWKMDKRVIEEDLVRWYDEEIAEGERTEMRPGAFEARFGPPGYVYEDEDALSNDDPLVLRAGQRELRLLGRIDRIDWDDARTSYRVTDYKTGKSGLSAKAVLNKGEMLQLPIYLHAAGALLGLDPANGEAQYFYVSSRGEFKRHEFTAAELASHGAAFEQVLETIASGVDNGYFAPNPGSGGTHCKWCDYKDICDARITKIMEKKDDPRAAAYRALEEIK